MTRTPGQRIIVNDYLDATYLGNGRARVEVECVWERGCFDTWYSVKPRVITLSPSARIRIV